MNELRDELPFIECPMCGGAHTYATCPTAGNNYTTMKIYLYRHYGNAFQAGIGKTSPQSKNIYIHFGWFALAIERD